MEFVKIDKISSKAFTALVANKIELISGASIAKGFSGSIPPKFEDKLRRH